MDADDYQQVQQLFDDYMRMYSTRDDRLTMHFSDDFSGFTGGGDFLVKDKATWVAITRQDFAQIKDPIRIEMKDVSIQPLAGKTAVATAFFHIHLPIQDCILSRETARLVLIFRQEPGGWKISHSSISIPYHLVREGEVYPVQELVDRNQFLEEQVAERTLQLSEANEHLRRTNAHLEREIAEHTGTEEALRSSEDRFRQLAMLFPETIFEADLDGRITYANEHGYQLFGLAPEDLVQSANLLDRVVPADRPAVLRRLRDRLEGRKGGFLEYTALRKDGSTFEALASSAPILQQGKAVGFRGFILDISERKRNEEEKANLEAQLHQAQKMESLGILVAGVAHNINNVLAIIMGTASMREQTVAEPSDLKAYQTIGKACRRGRDVVNSLMQFARPTLASQAPFDLHALIREVCDLLGNTTSKRIRIREAFTNKPLWINGDAGTINHSIMNLLINAIDAMPEGGTVTLGTLAPEEGWAELSVEDTGEGMSQEVLAHVMEPFFTTKDQGKGTGLGLSMTYGVIKAHGGTMAISSVPGQGTTVKLRLPRVAPPARAPRPPAPALPLASIRVLLVDDDEDVRVLMERMLRSAAGVQVSSVSGCEQALASLRSAELPDLIILDQNMPGADGSQALARIRNLHPTVPVLVSSGQPGVQEWDCFKTPNVAVISKPFTTSEILAKLAQFSGDSARKP
ncbi:MAG: nuclear transport factor 2 family protein [Holophaga sp.]|nr:nuclear transport factor 2 family protein [Holophaga sp.]